MQVPGRQATKLSNARTNYAWERGSSGKTKWEKSPQLVALVTLIATHSTILRHNLNLRKNLRVGVHVCWIGSVKAGQAKGFRREVV